METIIACMRDKDGPARVRAAETVPDRGWGAPDQRVLLNEESVNTFRVMLVNADGTESDWNSRPACSAEAPVQIATRAAEQETVASTWFLCLRRDGTRRSLRARAAAGIFDA